MEYNSVLTIPKLEEDGKNVLKYMASNELVANPSKTALLFLNNKEKCDPEINIGSAKLHSLHNMHSTFCKG